MTRRPRLRFLTSAAVLAAIAAGVGAAVLLGANGAPTLRAGTALDTPRALGDLALVGADGRALDRRDFEGRWSLVFTGFTHCPDLCPTTLALLAGLRARLPDEGWRALFVSVDPERDTPARIGRYLSHFGGGLEGATGSAAEIEAFTRQLGLAQVRNPGAGGEYTVDHSAALVLVDPRARIAGYFMPPHDAEALAADLAGLPRS